MRILTIILLLCGALLVQAQTDPLFSQYRVNKIVYNPAAAGSADALRFTAVYRKQWNLEGAPGTISLTGDHVSKSGKHGYGGSLVRDTYGPTHSYTVMGQYAYRIKAGKGHFSMGLQGGIQFFQTEWGELTAVQGGDNAFINNSESAVVANFGVGFYYQNDKLSAGISVPQLLNSKLYEDSDILLANHYYAQFDYRFDIAGGKFGLRPGMLLKYTKGANAQLDMNLEFVIMQDAVIGFGYRTDKTLIILAQYELTFGDKSFMLGYSYDLANSAYRDVSSGGHEVLISIQLFKKIFMPVEEKL